MAPAPGQKKRILEPDEPALDRVTRQKARMATATDHPCFLPCDSIKAESKDGDCDGPSGKYAAHGLSDLGANG